MKHNLQKTTLPWIKRLLIVACLGLGNPAQAQTIQATYDVYAEKSKIGELEVVRKKSSRDGMSTTVIDTAMQLRVKTFLSSYTLDTKEHVVMNPKGVITYRADNAENGAKSHIEGNLKNDEFFLKIQEAEKVYNFPLPPLGYDPAMMVLVEHSKSSDAQENTLTFLDPDTFEFQNEQRTDRGEETLTIAGNTFFCRLIEFKTPSSRGKRWIAKDAIGPFLVKEVGSDRDGRYSLLMTLYSRLP